MVISRSNFESSMDFGLIHEIIGLVDAKSKIGYGMYVLYLAFHRLIIEV